MIYMANISNVKRVYFAPLIDVSEALEDVMICQSGTTEDWSYDDDLVF